MQDPNANTVGTDDAATTVRTQTAPNGYVIDRAIYAEDGITLTPVGWKSLFRADENYANELGFADIRYTDSPETATTRRSPMQNTSTACSPCSFITARGYEYGVPAID